MNFFCSNLTPNAFKSAFGPIPDSISNWGEFIDPALTIISRLA
jgi:hypothetical protein